MKAAIFHGPHQPLTIENIDIAKPIGREVLVRTVASGVCHSDLHFIEGLYPFAAPAVLGHEAAGIVEAVGPHVDEFKPGDPKVTVTAMASRGALVIGESVSRGTFVDGRSYENLYVFAIEFKDGKVHLLREYMDSLYTARLQGLVK